MSVWFVTGSSRGLGAEIVRAALEKGHQVVATARSADAVLGQFPDAGDRLLALRLDVTDPAGIATAVATAVARFGGIDVLVNNAGRGLLCAVEEADDDAVRAVYETNVFGLLAVQRAVLPLLRRQRSGHVINMSSIAAFGGLAGWGVYASTKYAVEGFSEALHAELAPLGVHVTLVEPGYFRTDFLEPSSLHTVEEPIDDYAATSGAMRQAVPTINQTQQGDPVKGARLIVEMASSAEPPLRLQLGSDTIQAAEAKLDGVRKEMDAWRHIAVTSDFN
ncbi:MULTISPECIES: oxidoreductase [unclassified Streptomyces]|uniref:oxidoreductase n=1 Tax=unclassified Streptomyces TaxID=2593676 RepID=UPI002476E91F|nr:MULTISPECIES: oxidoreductase [unclassified Streptomyces]MDH6455325.1 NAD(P)-dependent dehydrogenase (short-subunit alcohol dehydrogenase family) [Streptomyces sp. SAI-119]MDH6494122.1 NAD(P)-dependent dehydrogenase (short-subunit alcohol dehydrogenase family) [Streptomyces sp. SAI-149]